jgi:hypothetical protein
VKLKGGYMSKLKLILIVLIAAVVISAQSFEGFVKYKVEGEGETSFLKYYKKGENVRMEPEMKDMEMGGAILFKDGKTYMLMPAQNMYMEFEEGMFDMMEDESVEEEEYNKPVNTGETKDILGYSCEKWIFEDEEYITEVWAAKGLGEFVMLSAPMAEEKMPDWYNDLSEGGFFPMLVEAKKRDGSLDGRMEVVEIKEESVPNSMFEIPSNYSKFSMPGMN